MYAFSILGVELVILILVFALLLFSYMSNNLVRVVEESTNSGYGNITFTQNHTITVAGKDKGISFRHVLYAIIVMTFTNIALILYAIYKARSCCNE